MMGVRGVHSNPHLMHLHLVLILPQCMQIFSSVAGAGYPVPHVGHHTILGLSFDMLYHMIYQVFTPISLRIGPGYRICHPIWLILTHFTAKNGQKCTKMWKKRQNFLNNLMIYHIHGRFGMALHRSKGCLLVLRRKTHLGQRFQL